MLPLLCLQEETDKRTEGERRGGKELPTSCALGVYSWGPQHFLRSSSACAFLSHGAFITALHHTTLHTYLPSYVPNYYPPLPYNAYATRVTTSTLKLNHPQTNNQQSQYKTNTVWMCKTSTKQFEEPVTVTCHPILHAYFPLPYLWVHQPTVVHDIGSPRYTVCKHPTRH